jgi:hypothetical protein
LNESLGWSLKRRKRGGSLTVKELRDAAPTESSSFRVKLKGSEKKEEHKTMKYMLLIYHEERAWDGLSEQERQNIYGEYRKFSEDIVASGHYLGGSELHPVATATSVRVRDGEQLTTDGPFAETKEQLGGYYLIEAANLDEAISIAARIPSARVGTIEVRPLAEGEAAATA